MTENVHGVGGGSPPPIDTTRRVFAVPVEYVVQCQLFVLATDLTEARAKAREIDLEELISFDTDQFWTDNTERLKVEDVRVGELFTISAKPTTDYDPADHPDWTSVGEL